MQLSRDKILGLIGLFGSAFIGGAISPILIKTGAGALGAFVFNWLRASLGLLILLPLYTQKHSLSEIFQKKNYTLMTILGLGVGLNITMFSLGVQHTTLIASQLVYVLIPVVVSIIAYITIGEKINLKKALGIAMSLLGIGLLIFFSRSPGEIRSLGTFYGNSLIFIGMFGYAIYITYSKKYTKNLDTLSLITLSTVAQSIFLFPLFLVGLPQLHSQSVTSTAVLATILIAVTSVVFFFMLQLAIKKLSAGTASLSTLIGPEFAAIAGILLYGERLSPILIISLLLSIGGVIVSTSAETRGIFVKLFKR